MDRLKELMQLESKLKKEIAMLQAFGQCGLQRDLQKELQKIQGDIETYKKRLA